MSARSARGLLGRGLELLAGLEPGEGAAAVELAERVAGGVRVAGAVVKELRAGPRRRRRPGGAPLPARVKVVDAEVIDAEVVDAEVVDAEVVDATPARYR